MREASDAAAEPRRSITVSRTSVRPLQVIHTGAPSLIKPFGVLAPPDPRRLIPSTFARLKRDKTLLS